MGDLKNKSSHLLAKDGHLITDCNCCTPPVCICTSLSDPFGTGDAHTPYRAELTIGTLIYCTACQTGTNFNSARITSSTLNGQVVQIDGAGSACTWVGESTNASGENGWYGGVHLVHASHWTFGSADPDTNCLTDGDHTPDFFSDVGAFMEIRDASYVDLGSTVVDPTAIVTLRLFIQFTSNPSGWLALLFKGEMPLTTFCATALTTGVTFTNLFTACNFQDETNASSLYPGNGGNLAYGGTIGVKLVPIP